MKKCLPRHRPTSAPQVFRPHTLAKPKLPNWLSTAEDLIPHLVKILHGVKALVLDGVIIFLALYPEFHRFIG